jgi:hypothetical protein
LDDENSWLKALPTAINHAKHAKARLPSQGYEAKPHNEISRTEEWLGWIKWERQPFLPNTRFCAKGGISGFLLTADTDIVLPIPRTDQPPPSFE